MNAFYANVRYKNVKGLVVVFTQSFKLIPYFVFKRRVAFGLFFKVVAFYIENCHWFA